MDQASYATYFFAKYLYTATIKENSNLPNIALPYDIIFTKEDSSVVFEQVEVLFR